MLLFFQAIYELYQGEVDLIEDLNIVKKVKLNEKEKKKSVYYLQSVHYLAAFTIIFILA